MEFAADRAATCVRAASFPRGVKLAHETLHGLTGSDRTLDYFGISFPDKNGAIIYLAGAAAREGTLPPLPGTESFTVRKGKYLGAEIEDYMRRIHEFGTTFEALLKDPRIDPAGYCLEWYLDDARCLCLVKLNDD